LLVCVFLDDAERVFVRVEGGHEDEWNVDSAGGVKVLDLTYGQIEESHIVFDFQGTLGTRHA